MSFYFDNSGASDWITATASASNGAQPATEPDTTSHIFRATLTAGGFPGIRTCNAWVGIVNDFAVPQTDANVFQYDTTNVTVLQSGLYVVSLNVGHQDASPSVKGNWLRVNGTTVMAESQSQFSYTQQYQNTTCILRLEANDQLQFMFESPTSEIYNTTYYTHNIVICAVLDVA